MHHVRFSTVSVFGFVAFTSPLFSDGVCGVGVAAGVTGVTGGAVSLGGGLDTFFAAFLFCEEHRLNGTTVMLVTVTGS